MTQTLTYENTANQSGQSVQSDVEVDGIDLLQAANDLTGITLEITWENQSSWQGCECYVVDPDGSYHYVFTSGSLPFGSGTRTDTVAIGTGSFPYSIDGTWEFYLSDQMFGTVTVDEVKVEVEVTSANMPATYSETNWWNGSAYPGGIDLTNQQEHSYPTNNASMVADTQSGGTTAFSFDGVDDAWQYPEGTTAYDAAGTCSWSMWVNPASLATKGIIFCNHGYRKGNFQVYLSGATVNIFLGYFDPSYSSSDGMRVYANTINTTNQWYHIAIVFDGSEAVADRVKIWIDDQAETTTTIEYGNGITALPPSTLSGAKPPISMGGLIDVSLGGTPSGTIRYPLNGLTDDCRAWAGYKLTTTDITWLASARGVAGGPPPPASFKSYFRNQPIITGFPHA